MAPRRITVRRGETRMDAAICHLSQYGFSEDAICKKVNELLKVYGGPEGWVFIEDAAYSLVIDELLRVEEGTEPGPQYEVANRAILQADAGSSSAAGPSNATAEPFHDMSQDLMSVEMTCEDGSHQDFAMTHVDDVSSPKHDSTNNKDEVFTPEADEHVPAVESSLPDVSHGSSQRRKPCYGWWGTCDEDDVIHLPRMPVYGESTHQRQVARRSRWDAGPLHEKRNGYR